jgi:ferritin-like metal-binding protein YciE
MDATRKDLVKLLAEAHSNELALVSVLESHIPLTENSAYRALLEDHLEETKSHAERIQQRLDTLGYSKSAVTLTYQTAQGILKQVLVLTKAPVDMLRGGGDINQKMLKNAIDESMTEGLEIAAYDAIEAMALAFGDTVTAELAASIRLDEEAMFNGLRKLIPVLAQDVAADSSPDVGRQEPWSGYDEMTVDEIIGRLDDCTIGQTAIVREYETRNKNRKTILEATDK